MSSTRKFRLVHPENYGRFTGKTPSQAGSKAFTYLAKKKKSTGQNIKFTIQEMTQNSQKKEYKYIGQRSKLKEPVFRQVGGNSFSFNYKNKIKRHYG